MYGNFYPRAMAPERVLLILRFVVKELLLSSPPPENLLKNFCPNSQRKMFPNTNLYLKGSQIQITYGNHDMQTNN